MPKLHAITTVWLDVMHYLGRHRQSAPIAPFAQRMKLQLPQTFSSPSGVCVPFIMVRHLLFSRFAPAYGCNVWADVSPRTGFAGERGVPLSPPLRFRHHLR